MTASNTSKEDSFDRECKLESRWCQTFFQKRLSESGVIKGGTTIITKESNITRRFMAVDLGTMSRPKGRCSAGGGAHAIHHLGLPTNHNYIIQQCTSNYIYHVHLLRINNEIAAKPTRLA